MKPKSLHQLQAEAEHLRRCLAAGGLPTATREFVRSKLIDIEAEVTRRSRDELEGAAP